MERKLQKSKWLGLIPVAFLLAMLLSLSALAAPRAVTGLKQTGDSTSSVQVEWDAVTGTRIRYQVAWSDNQTNWATSTSYSPRAYISNLSSGKTYYVKVAVIEDDVLGDYSNVIQVVTRPGMINSGTVEQSDAKTNAISLQWPAVTGATGYRVYDYVNGTSGQERGVATGNGITISGLSPETEYTFLIVPERANGSYTAANTYGVIARATTLSTGVTGIDLSSGSYKSKTVSMRWDGKSNVDGYEIQLYNYKGKKKVGKKIEASAYSSYAQLKGVKPNSFYQVKIRSYVMTSAGKKYSAWTTAYTNTQPQVKVRKSGSAISLSWKKVQGATNYTIYGRKGRSNDRDTFKKLGQTKSVKYTVKKIKKQKIKKKGTYSFFVVADRKVKGKTYSSAVGYSFTITLR